MRCLLDYMQSDQRNIMIFPGSRLGIVYLGVGHFVILFKIGAPRFRNNSPGSLSLDGANVTEFGLLRWKINSWTFLESLVDPFLMP